VLPCWQSDPRIARVDLNYPGYPELNNHRHSLGLETGFWTVGINGGVHDVGVLDTGVQQNHPPCRRTTSSATWASATPARTAPAWPYSVLDGYALSRHGLRPGHDRRGAGRKH